jgi:hypothetical protein
MKKFRPLCIAGGIGLIFIGLSIYRMPDQDVVTPRTQLSFSELQKNVKVGDTFTLDLVGNPDGNAIILMEPHIQFDSSVLQLTGITKGSIYPQVLSTEQITGGKATITVGSPSLAQPVRTAGVVVHLTFRAIKAADAIPISIDEVSFVGASMGSSTPKNMLAKTTGATVTITN